MSALEPPLELSSRTDDIMLLQVYGGLFGVGIAGHGDLVCFSHRDSASPARALFFAHSTLDAGRTDDSNNLRENEVAEGRAGQANFMVLVLRLPAGKISTGWEFLSAKSFFSCRWQIKPAPGKSEGG